MKTANPKNHFFKRRRFDQSRLHYAAVACMAPPVDGRHDGRHSHPAGQGTTLAREYSLGDGSRVSPAAVHDEPVFKYVRDVMAEEIAKERERQRVLKAQLGRGGDDDKVGEQLDLDPTGGWDELLDDVTGKPFFYNRRSGQVTWSRPVEFLGEPKAELGGNPKDRWEKIMIPGEVDAYGEPACFYYNSYSGVTVERRPAGIKLPDDPNSSDEEGYWD